MTYRRLRLRTLFHILPEPIITHAVRFKRWMIPAINLRRAGLVRYKAAPRLGRRLPRTVRPLRYRHVLD